MSSTIRSPGYRKLLLPAALSLAVMSLSAHAGESWVSTNTHAAIQKSAKANVSNLVMKGHPAVAANQIMPVEQSKPLHIVVTLNQRNTQQLHAFLRDVNTVGSPSYHKYLTPAQFKAQYAPTDAQVQAVVAHLQKYGFKNIEVAPNNALVSADGTGMSVNGAFNTAVQTFSFQGKQHFANSSDAMVPQALGGIVGSVQGLQDVVTAHVMSHAVLKPSANIAKPAGQGVGAQAAAPVLEAHSPVDLGKIYSADRLAAATNTTVGIIGWDDMVQTVKDLKSYTTQAGLAAVDAKIVQTGKGPYQAGDPAEWSMDSQAIVGVSGGVKQLIFYTAPGPSLAAVTAAYNRAVTDNVAKVINVSLGVDEEAAHDGGSQAADDQIFAQAVAQGQTFSVASGDAGVYQWSDDGTGIGYVTDSAGKVQVDLTKYSVSEPMASPHVVAVGGTMLSTIGTAWAGETVWNEGLAAIDPNAQVGPRPDNNQRLWATGGGVSLYEDAPAWQTAALGAAVTKRQVPDIAFDAASETGVKLIVNGRAAQYGGTSLAAPIFAGIWARIESANNNSLGLPTENFYTYFPKDSAPLHDVIRGDNGYLGHGYVARAGYDNATGWGSLDAAKLSAYVTKYWGGGNPPAAGAPVASFTNKVNGLTVTFTNSSTDTGGAISAYAWSFGDGASSTVASPSHTYAAAGTYNVSLKVTDNTGATNTTTTTQQVTVASANAGGNVFNNTKPVAIGTNATISSSIAVTGIAGKAPKALKVHASITHNKSGDLQVKIIAPNGGSAVLKKATYAAGGNIDTTWTVDASGVAANGTWKLQVIDYDRARNGDKGTLNSWSLTF